MDPDQDGNGRRWSTDQKRAILSLVVIAIVVAVVVVGIGSVLTTLGLSFWLSAIIAITIGAVVVLFLIINLI